CSSMQLERLFQLTAAERTLEGDDIAREVSEVEANLLIAPARERVRTPGVADHMQCLTQRGAGMLLVELRPKKWQQAVTAMEARWCRGSEIGEEREASGLAEQGPHIAPVGACEAQSPEQAKLDHAGPRRCAAQSDRKSTRL